MLNFWYLILVTDWKTHIGESEPTDLKVPREKATCGFWGVLCPPRTASSFPFEVGVTTVTFTEEKTEALRRLLIAMVTMMLCHTLQWMELLGVSGVPLALRVAWTTGKRLPAQSSPPCCGVRQQGQLWVFGAVRRAGCVALASLGPSGLCPSQPEGV